MSDSDRTMRLGRRGLVKAASTGAVVLAGVGASAVAAPAAQQWDMEADVVVLGMGGAGACAAMAAHDAGANVLILEKQAEASHFPSTRMSSGIWHSPDKDGNRAAIKSYALAMFSGENVAGKLEGEMDHQLGNDLADIWAAEVPEVMDFLKGLDPDFKPVRGAGINFPSFPGAEQSKYRAYISSYTGKVDMSVPTLGNQKSEKTAGEAFFACLKGGVDARKIKIAYETPANELITNSDGSVIGVIATQKGKSVAIKALRGVIITTGGYAWNARMRDAFLPGPGVKGWAFWGTPAGTGDGIEMAMRAGAGLQKIAAAAGGLTIAVPLPGSDFKMGIGATGAQPHSIIVDNLGKRYTDETVQMDDPSRYYFYNASAAFDVATRLNTRAPSWMIFDERVRSGPSLAMQGIGGVAFGLVTWSKDNMEAVHRGWLLTAGTIEELGAKIKAHQDNCALMDPALLAKTTTQFNSYCANGKDPDFNRRTASMGAVDNAPFYALPLYVGGPNTHGGIAVNARREVVSWDDKPVPRLYSAGEVSSAFKYVYQSGGNLSEGIIFGRIAGRNAAAQKQWT